MLSRKIKQTMTAILIGFAILLLLIVYSVVMMVLSIQAPTGLSDGLIVSIFVVYLVSVGDVFFLTYLLVRRASLIGEKATISAAFEDDRFIWSQKSFVKRIAKSMAKIDKNTATGTIFALSTFASTTNIANLKKSINTLILDHLEKQFTATHDFTFGLSPNGVFLIFFLGENKKEFREHMLEFASRLSSAFENRADIPYLSVLVGCEDVTGISNIEESLRRAIYALGHDTDGRLSGDLLQYDENIEKEEKSRRDLDGELTKALQNEELVVYYQGKFSLRDNTYYGAEALIRWKHPRRGIVPPSVFIPYCEHSGRIVEIDRYLFEHVCQDIEKWNLEHNVRLVVSVNLSRRSVYDPSLLPFMVETIKAHHIYPSQINVELTESLAASNVIFIEDVIRKIKALGFHTSIDDFGIGYSSMAALKSIPFDVLKIDKTFIDDIETDFRSRNMVQAIITLGHSINMSVLAEGVETEAQVNYLREMGLDSVQGYYYSRPTDHLSFESFIVSKWNEKRLADRNSKKEVKA